MKFAAIRGRGAAVVDPGQGRVWPLDDGLADMIDLIGRWDEVKQTIGPKGDGLAQADVRLEAPIPRPPRNVFCRPGDEVSIAISGIGRLTNRIAQTGKEN